MKILLLFLILACACTAEKVVGTHTHEGLGFGPSVSDFAAPSSANTALFVPFRLQDAVTVRKMGVMNGPTVSGHFDVGIYDASFNLLTSAGSTTQTGTNSAQVVDVPDVILSASTDYYLAFSTDGTTGTYWGNNKYNGLLDIFGVLKQTSAFPLPSTASPVAAGTIYYIPILTASPSASYA